MNVISYQRSVTWATTPVNTKVETADQAVLDMFTAIINQSGWTVATSSLPTPSTSQLTYTVTFLLPQGHYVKFTLSVNTSFATNNMAVALVDENGNTISNLDNITAVLAFSDSLKQVSCSFRYDQFYVADTYDATFYGVPGSITGGLCACKLKNKVGTESADWLIGLSTSHTAVYSPTGVSYSNSYITAPSGNNDYVIHDPIIQASSGVLAGTIEGVVGCGTAVTKLLEYSVDGLIYVALNDLWLIPT
jgi:hypothetical protein